MKAWRLHTAGGPSGLALDQVDIPEPAESEVLVRVHAAAITRDELDWPVDRLPAIPSYEFSGVVARVGSRVQGWSEGDPVYALTPFDRDGAAAEYTTVDGAVLAAKPSSIDHVHCASIPLAALSAWQGLFEHGGLAQAERVLIHGATGGVGHFAVQMALRHGAYVIGSVSGRNLEAARRLGLNEVIDATAVRFEEVVQEVDLVFDTVGGTRLEHSPIVIRPGGRLVSIASEPSQEKAKERGIRAEYFVVRPSKEGLAEVSRLVDSGFLRPIAAEVFPLAQGRLAFERSLTPHGPGKIVLRIADG